MMEVVDKLKQNKLLINYKNIPLDRLCNLYLINYYLSTTAHKEILFTTLKRKYYAILTLLVCDNNKLTKYSHAFLCITSRNHQK